MRLLGVLLMIVCTCGPAAALAEQNPEYFRALSTLSDINKDKPWQNRQSRNAAEVLKSRLTDNTNKVVGEIRDVILNASGSIAALDIDFNRLRLGRASVNFSQLNAESSGNGFRVRHTDNEIEQMFPAMLDAMESAAGAQGDTMSLRKLIGAPVKNARGRTIGRVKDVLFANFGTSANYLYIETSLGIVNKKALAVPFSFAKYQTGSSPQVVLDNDAGAAFSAYASN